MTRAGSITPMALRGISYDVGTDYAGHPTRWRWHLPDVVRDLTAIRDDLHCTTVNLYGTDLERLRDAARIALGVGLKVWIQPRLIDRPVAEVVDHVVTAAADAEQLSTARHRPDGEASGSVVLNLGCEWSVFTPGIIPGGDYHTRADRLARPYYWPAFPWFNRILNRRLRSAHERARAVFTGPITYSAGLWERVDWTMFDLVGLNYYRLTLNRRSYARRLQRYHRYKRPVVITEFGCGAFVGADALGPQTHSVVSYGEAGPVLRAGLVRDEHVQARYLTDLLAIYRGAGVYGAFVFEFVEPYKPHHDDPARDLDMAGYGIVKVIAQGGHGETWQPKAAYAGLARVYDELAHSSTS